MLHALGQLLMRYFSVIGLCVIVAGCSLGKSDRIAYQESPDERMTRIVLAGRQECETKFPTSPRHNHVAQAKCVVAFDEQVVVPQDEAPDLIRKRDATRLVVAERLDKGTMSEAEANQQMADAKSAAISELLHRRSAGRPNASADGDRASRKITSDDRGDVGAESLCCSGSRSMSGSRGRALQIVRQTPIALLFAVAVLVLDRGFESAAS